MTKYSTTGSGVHYFWVYHLGPLKIVFGEKTAELFRDHFEQGLRTGLHFEGFTREWMKKERGMQ